MNAAIYCRVSTEEQRERQSIDTQHDFAERYCTLHTIPVHDYYQDNGVSGTLPVEQRPEGRRLLRDAREGLFRVVLVYRLDRLGRNPQHMLNVIAELEALGVQVKSMTEPFDTSEPVGRFMVTMLSGVAGLERDTIVARAKAGSERVARSGGWLGGHPPFGYHVEGKGKNARLVLADEPIPQSEVSEAEVVRQMYRLVGEEGQSCRQVADYLNQHNIQTASYRMDVTKRRTRNGFVPSGVWSPARVRNVLTSTVYKGLHQYGKRDAKDKLGREIIERAAPALVSVQLWDQTQEGLRQNLRFSPRNAKHPYLLRGLIKCGMCGHVYSGMTSSDGHAYYRCPAKYKYGAAAFTAAGTRCAAKPVCGRDLERVVWEDIEGFLRHPGAVIEALRERMQGQEEQEGAIRVEVEQLEGRLHGLDHERDTMLTLYRKGRIDSAALDRQLDQIAPEEKAIRLRLALLQSQLGNAEARAEQLNTAEALLRELCQRLDNGLTWETKRRIVELLVEQVRVDTIEREGVREAEVHITYRFGPITTCAECRASPTRSCRTTGSVSRRRRCAPAWRRRARCRPRASEIQASPPTRRWGRRRCAPTARSTPRGRG